MAFPQVVGSQLSSRASNAIDDTVDLPASVAAGDLLLVFHYSDGATTRTFPGSWVEIKDATVSGDMASIGVAYLIAAGGETSVVVTKSVTERFTAIAIRISAASWHGTTAPEISTGIQGSSTTPNPDVLNPAGWDIEDTLWIAAMCWDDGAGTMTVNAYPYASNNLVSAAVNSAGRGAIATLESAVASEDPGTFTLSATDQWWAGTVAVRPAAAAAATDPALLHYNLSNQFGQRQVVPVPM